MREFNPTLSQLQKVRAHFDTENPVPYKNHEVHSAFHISRAAQKIFDAIEISEHTSHAPDFSVIDKEVIPDLVIIASMLANARNIKLEEAVLERMYEIESRGAIPGSVERAINSVE